MVVMILASVPKAVSEALLLYFGVANGTSSASTGASMKTTIKVLVKMRFTVAPLLYESKIRISSPGQMERSDLTASIG
jgi:hypothetical protein